MQIQVSGISDLQTRLSKFQRGLEHREPLISKCGDILVDDIRKNILTEGKRLGIKWEHLKAMTQELRRRHGFQPSHPILIETGNMISGIAKTKADNYEAVVEPTGLGGIPAQENVAKALRHQYGQKERNVPPRRFLEISKLGIRDVKRAVETYVAKLLTQ